MSKIRSSLSTSVRRHFVDNFFTKYSEEFREKRIIDIGGKKEKKRGNFNIGELSQQVTYVNIDKETNPDIVADATNIPLNDNFYDVILMGELLEHVPDPIPVLKEARRLLKPGGKIFATVPFLYPVHADPYDFGRYTDHYWRESTKKLGFSDMVVERHGALFAVWALGIQHIFRAYNKSWRPIQIPLVAFLMWLDRRISKPLLLDWTTGFGIVMTK